MANGIRIRLDGADKLSGTLRARAKVFGEKQTKAVQATAMRVAQEIENEGRSNIAKGGKFTSARWQDGFRAKVSFISRANPYPVARKIFMSLRIRKTKILLPVIAPHPAIIRQL